MEWLSNLTNGENGSAINLVLITLAIALLLIVIVWIFRKMTGSAAKRAMRSRVPRLSITDSTTVDEKRYLVMIRRDNVEHLLLIGGANDLVVESNIVRAQTAQKPVGNAQTTIKQSEAIKEPTSESEASIAAPVAGAAALGAAGIAAVTSTTSSAAATVSEASTDVASSLTDTVSSATEAVTETAGDVISSVTDTVSETVSDTTSMVADKASEVVQDVTETISPDVEAPAEVEVEVEIAEPAEEVEVPEMDLESTISAKLDDALSTETLDISLDEAEANIDTTVTDPKSGSDDEMQRLLDELSGEVKEPAQ